MHIVRSIVLALLLVISATAPSLADFTVMAAPYPPFSVSKGLRVEGMSVTTLKAIMKMCDTPLRNTSFKLTPWAYAYESTARMPQQIVLNAQRTPQTEQLYKWVGPVVTSKVVLIGKKQDNLFIPRKSDLKNYKIATIRWSRPEKTLLAEGFNADTLYRSPAHVSALRKLNCGEVDLFAYTQRGVPYLMKGLGMKASDYAVYYTLEEAPLYFAFSKDTNDSFIQRLNAALKAFKATGKDGTSQFDRMFSSYTK